MRQVGKVYTAIAQAHQDMVDAVTKFIELGLRHPDLIAATGEELSPIALPYENGYLGKAKFTIDIVWEPNE
jgi:hypothetical protein